MALDFNLVDDRPPAMGLIILQTDELVEPELGLLFGGFGIRTYHNRIPAMPEVRTAAFATMADDMTRTAAMLPPDAGYAAIAYACTSGATVLGEKHVEALVQEAHPGIPVTNPLTALKAACRALGISRLGVLTPYVAEVADALNENLEADGITVSASGSFEQAEDKTVARIDPRSTLDALIDIGEGNCQAVFASCTNLRAFEIVEAAEARIDKPVFCSNQVLAWHMLRLAGIDAAIDGRGRLFREALG